MRGSISSNRTRWVVLLGMLVAVFALVGAACGGDDDDSSAPAPAPAEEPAAPAEEPAPPAEEPPAEEPPAEEPAPPAEEPPAEEPPAEASGEPIRIGVLSDCEGAFAPFFEADIGGALTPLVARGATALGENPTDGVEGATIAGRPIEVVTPFGCADDTPEGAIAETRRLVEQEGVDILIGPLSGDEGIAVANYSLEHPEVTFINGTSGAQDTTLKVQSPNFFRWNSDGAQWSAGLGDYARNVLGWDEAVVIADDYSFAYTSAAGFIAEFCAAGGTISKRIWPALGETDYTSFVAQIDPDDNVFAAVGTPIPFLRAYEDVVGPIDPDKFVGNLFYGDPIISSEFGGRLDGVALADSIWADSTSAEAMAYSDLINATYPSIGGGGEHSVFVYNYYNAAEAMARALEEVGGVLQEDGHAAFREALTNLVLEDAAYGSVSLDENRQAIQDNFVKINLGEEGGVVTIWKVPGVTQDFGGTFTSETPPPDRENPPCEVRELPWVGNAEVVGEAGGS